MILLLFEVFLPVQYNQMEVIMKTLLTTAMALALVLTVVDTQSASANCGASAYRQATVSAYGYRGLGWKGHRNWDNLGYRATPGCCGYNYDYYGNRY